MKNEKTIMLSEAIDILKKEKEIKETFIRKYGDISRGVVDINENFPEAVDTVTDFINEMVCHFIRR